MNESSPDFAEREAERNLVDLATYGIAPDQAVNLRGRLAAFAEDWHRPEMDVYDAL